ncbi:MAG: hypothetical protein NT159_05690 [Proteobacteria bacterium]|nr:hypothetical protein [Pseudomonadota bacterium]
MKPRLHNIDAIPEGKTVGDILPAFANVKNMVHVGEPNSDCASCRKPFTVVRKPRKAILLYPYDTQIPCAFSYRVCGACLAIYQRGGLHRDSFLAAVEAYHNGDSLEAMQ